MSLPVTVARSRVSRASRDPARISLKQGDVRRGPSGEQWIGRDDDLGKSYCSRKFKEDLGEIVWCTSGLLAIHDSEVTIRMIGSAFRGG